MATDAVAAPSCAEIDGRGLLSWNDGEGDNPWWEVIDHKGETVSVHLPYGCSYGSVVLDSGLTGSLLVRGDGEGCAIRKGTGDGDVVRDGSGNGDALRDGSGDGGRQRRCNAWGLGKAIPYGIYDVTNDTGWVSVGEDHDTAVFAVETLRRWWLKMGSVAYPEARSF